MSRQFQVTITFYAETREDAEGAERQITNTLQESRDNQDIAEMEWAIGEMKEVE